MSVSRSAVMTVLGVMVAGAAASAQPGQAKSGRQEKVQAVFSGTGHPAAGAVVGVAAGGAPDEASSLDALIDAAGTRFGEAALAGDSKGNSRAGEDAEWSDYSEAIECGKSGEKGSAPSGGGPLRLQALWKGGKGGIKGARLVPLDAAGAARGSADDAASGAQAAGEYAYRVLDATKVVRTAEARAGAVGSALVALTLSVMERPDAPDPRTITDTGKALPANPGAAGWEGAKARVRAVVTLTSKGKARVECGSSSRP